jgi:hypothetical protein
MPPSHKRTYEISKQLETLKCHQTTCGSKINKRYSPTTALYLHIMPPHSAIPTAPPPMFHPPQGTPPASHNNGTPPSAHQHSPTPGGPSSADTQYQKHKMKANINIATIG